MYRNAGDDALMKAGWMEARRLLLYDRAYISMHRKYWDVGTPPVTTEEEKQKHAKIRATMARELEEYTASDAFDPELAKQVRKKLRKGLKEDLKKGTWYSRFDVENEVIL